VPGVEIGEQLRQQIGPAAALPQMMMGVDDRQVRFEDFLVLLPAALRRNAQLDEISFLCCRTFRRTLHLVAITLIVGSDVSLVGAEAAL
jgi:hypothetical protein